MVIGAMVWAPPLAITTPAISHPRPSSTLALSHLRLRAASGHRCIHITQSSQAKKKLEIILNKSGIHWKVPLALGYVRGTAALRSPQHRTQARSRRKTTTTVTLSVAPRSSASPSSRLAIMSGDLAVWQQQWTMRASSSTWMARRQRNQRFRRRFGEALWLHHTAQAAAALL